MKLVGTLGLVVVGGMLMGCSAGAPQAKAPADIGTTSLSSASGLTRVDPNPLFLDMEAEPAQLRTWGSAAGAAERDPAEPDLAANPYTGARDIYDPR